MELLDCVLVPLWILWTRDNILIPCLEKNQVLSVLISIHSHLFNFGLITWPWIFHFIKKLDREGSLYRVSPHLCTHWSPFNSLESRVEISGWVISSNDKWHPISILGHMQGATEVWEELEVINEKSNPWLVAGYAYAPARGSPCHKLYLRLLYSRILYCQKYFTPISQK